MEDTLIESVHLIEDDWVEYVTKISDNMGDNVSIYKKGKVYSDFGTTSFNLASSVTPEYFKNNYGKIVEYFDCEYNSKTGEITCIAPSRKFSDITMLYMVQCISAIYTKFEV